MTLATFFQILESRTRLPHWAARQLEGLSLGILCCYIILVSVSPYMYGRFIAPLLAFALIALLIVRRDVPGLGLVWTLALLVTGTTGVAVGWLRDNPGAIETATIFVVEPVVVGLAFVLALQSSRSQVWIQTALDVSCILVTIIAICLFVIRLQDGFLPTWLIDPDYTAVDLSDGTPRTNYQGFNAFVFLGAYGLYRVRMVKRGNIWLPLLVGLAALTGIALSGRRVLFVAIPAAILLVALLTRTTPMRELVSRWGRRRILLVTATSGTSIVILGLLAPVMDVARSVMEVQRRDSTAEGVRSDQSAILLDQWMTSPIWGNGAGYVIEGYQRNSASPWTFELSYHVLLMDFGFVGFVVLAAWTLWIGRALLGRGRSGDLFATAVLTGWISTLLATATNPYLFKIDGMWMVMIPFGMAVLAHSKGKVDQ